MNPGGAPYTTAVLGRLRTSLIPVGDARRPDGAGWQGAAGSSSFRTYLVLYPIDTVRQSGEASLGDSNDAPQWGYQVTAVGRDRLSAQTAADIAAGLLLNGVPLDLAGTGHAVALRHTMGLGVSVDESVSPPLFTAIDRYRLDTEPT